MPVVDIYCRSAAWDDNTLEAQEAACRKLAEQMGLTVGNVYAEIAPGSTLERQQLTLLRKRYLAGEIRDVIIQNPERLSRSAVHQAILMSEMDEHDIHPHCVDVKVDHTLKILRELLHLMADVEREKRDNPFAVLTIDQDRD